MDLITLFGVMRRRLLLILAVAVVCTAGVGYALRPGKLAYETQVRVQLTTPQSEDVALLNGYRSSNVRDESTLARNNFLVVLKSPEVFDRTAKELAHQPADEYSVEGKTLRDTDFIDVTVRAETPALAVRLANVHVEQAIHRYGELRAKPAGATRNFLAEQLKNAATGAPTAADPARKPEQAKEARDSYDMLLKKYSEAMLAEENAHRATYVQVVSRAAAATEVATAKRMATIVGLAGVGGLGLGTMVAFVVESFRVRRVVVEPPPVRYEPARPAHAALPQLALQPAFVDGTVLTEGSPIVAGPARWMDAQPPVVLDPVEQHRLEVRRGLIASRYLLRQAAARLDASERDTVGAVVGMMRRDVDGAWRALRVGAFPAAVATTLRRNIEGTARTAELFGLRVTDALAIAKPVATSVVEDESALGRLTQHAWAPTEALAVVRALATELDGCPETAQPASWTPVFELAAA